MFMNMDISKRDNVAKNMSLFDIVMKVNSNIIFLGKRFWKLGSSAKLENPILKEENP